MIIYRELFKGDKSDIEISLKLERIQGNLIEAKTSYTTKDYNCDGQGIV